MNPTSTNTDSLLVEVAWEVCNQLGGIYTVIRSKVPSMVNAWGDNYCLLGPYVHRRMPAEFEPAEDYDDPFGRAVLRLREQGLEAYYGFWLVSGRPRVVLLNPNAVMGGLGNIKYLLWEHHGIRCVGQDALVDQVLAFGSLVTSYFRELVKREITDKNVVAHFHEWMVGTPLPDMRREMLPVTTVFTTHATQLGRYLAMNDDQFYEHLPFFDWYQEAQHFNVETKVLIERSAAQSATVFTTVSDVTARECEVLLGRTPDLVTPNGLNIQRFVALHEFQNLHQEYKKQIHEFVMGHFFQSYAFDLDKTLYFFTSGRYEYHNKGFDITLEALARLNWMMRSANVDTTVIMFLITKNAYHSINPGVLQSRAMMQEIRQNCVEIQKQVGEKMFYAVASGSDQKLPVLNDFVDDYWKLRLRRTLQSWRADYLPPVVTHNLVNDGKDEILQFLRQANLLNYQTDRVKIVYHPDFISPSSPLFSMEYGQFIRGCHLGVFPSYYEPWGYTPLESIASGVPAVTSDLSGFGDYVEKNIPNYYERGIYVVTRRGRSFQDAAQQLAEQMFAFVQMNRRERIMQRNRVESSSEFFDWKHLTVYYQQAYDLGLSRR